VTHGGIVATIADTAGFFAAASLAGPRIATVEFKINLVAPARDDTLRAVASVVHRSRRLIVCQVRVTGARDVLIALAQATYATVGESSR
jgi:uncharacterized protein (TIGR00369 family)